MISAIRFPFNSYHSSNNKIELQKFLKKHGRILAPENNNGAVGVAVCQHEFRIAKQYRYRVNAQYRMDRSTVPVPDFTVKIFFPRGKVGGEGERRGSARGWFSGWRRKEETTIEKVPHPRLMVQSGPAVLFAHLSTSTDGTTVLCLHHHHHRRHHDIDTVGHPRRNQRTSTCIFPL